MKYIHLVEINGKKMELKDLQKEVREKMLEEGNRKAVMAVGYRRRKTA